MNRYKNPKWWSLENEIAWERVKPAMKRDWDQTRRDMEMSKSEAGPGQNAGNMVPQMSGKEAVSLRDQPAYEEMEPAYRFGYGARSAYRAEFPLWDDLLERRLREDWRLLDPGRNHKWERFREAVRFGWDYDDEDFEGVDHR